MVAAYGAGRGSNLRRTRCRWKLKDVPPAYPENVNLTEGQTGLSAASSTDAWLVGNDNESLIADQWGGSAWTQGQVETPADDYYQLTGVSALGSGTAFAVVVRDRSRP